MFGPLRNFIVEQDSPTMVEYGLLLALIMLVSVAAVGMFGQAVNNMLFSIAVETFENSH